MSQLESSPKPGSIRVLHVDDEDAHLEYAKTFLEMADETFHIESVTSPEEALRLLESETYDCIVSDFQMPGLDGIELARRVRETSDIPFILYTGRGSEDVAEAAFTVGVDDYLRKETDPSHYQVLTRRIRAAVEKHRSERALKKQMEEMQLILDTIPTTVWFKDTENRILRVNQAAADSVGLTVEDIEGRHAHDLFPEESEKYYRDDLEVINSGEPKRGIIEELQPPSGDRMWVRTDKVPYLDENGNVAGLIAYVVDITDPIETQEELRRSEEQYRALLEKGMDAVAIVVDSEYVYVNKTFLELLGYSESEMRGKRTSELVDPRDAGLLAEIVERRKNGEKQRLIYELRVLKKDGSSIWMEVSSIGAEFEGKPATISNSRDITERKRMEEDLKASEERYRSLVEMSPDSISVSIGSEIVYANRKRLELTGHSHHSELIGSNGLVNVFPEDREEILKRIQARERGEVIPSVQEFRLLRGERGIVHVIDHTSDIVWEGREAIMHILHDVSEIKRFEVRLEALHRHAIELASVESVEGIADVTLKAIKSVFGFQWSDFNVIKDDRIVPLLIQDEALRSNMELPLDGPGIIVRAYRTGEAQLVHDTRLDDDFVIGRDEEGEEWLSELAVPVKIADDVVAVINVEDKKTGAFTPDDQKLLEVFAEHIASAIDRLERMSALKSSEEKFRALLEESRDAIFVLDHEKYLYANSKGAELLGLSDPSELIGRDAFEFVASEDKEKVREMAAKRQKGEAAPSRYEFNLVNIDGKRIPVETNVSLIEYEGKPASLAINRDITERKRMEDEARKHRILLEALHKSSFKLSKHDHLHGMFMEALDIIKDVLGFQYLGIAQIKGDEITYDVAVEAYQPGDYKIPLDQPSVVGRVFKTGKPELISNTRLEPDYFDREISENEQRLSLLAVPVLVEGEVVAVIDVEGVEAGAFSEEDGKILEILAEHMSSAIRRIQSQQRIQELHDQHNRELLDGVQRVSSMVRHDLRGPLQTIMNAAYVAETNPKRTAEMMEIIMRSVKHQSDVLEDWKSQDLEETMNITETDLSQLISDTLAASLISTHITVDVNADPVKVNLDKVKMRRVMDNLIRNATEAMEDGGTLTISARENEHGIIIEVSDTGIGIPEAERENIFKPFYTTKPGGVGLGLTYSRRTVEAHGGTITVESEEGEGSTFRLSLPHLREGQS